MIKSQVIRIIKHATRRIQSPAGPRATLIIGTPATFAKSTAQPFTTGSWASKGLSPICEEPEPQIHKTMATTMKPVELSDEKYHTVSDLFIENMLSKLEQIQEDKEDVDVDYSVSWRSATSTGSSDFFSVRCPHTSISSHRHIRDQQAAA
jgi:frataxin